MRTPEEWLTVLALACAARGARSAGDAGERGEALDSRGVYEEGAEPWLGLWAADTPLALRRDLPPWLAGLAPLSVRRVDVAAPPASTLPAAAATDRERIANGLLTFDPTPPDPRLRESLAILVVRQLPVDAFLDAPPPPPPAPPQPRLQDEAPLPLGLLTFEEATPTPTPRPWWRPPPPVQLPVRPRLSGGAGGAETLALGSSPLVARLHGAVAMGSGGVGYARLPDGRLAIGSGSIGFAQFDVVSPDNTL